MNTTGHHFPGALKRLGGDEELFQELVDYFVEDTPGLLQTMRAGLAAGNAGSIQRAAHGLRGLVANFDAEQAVIIAGSIEQMAAQGQLPLIPAALARLEVEVQSLRMMLGG